MAENKKAFLLYADLIATVEKMSDDDSGKLLKHLLRYVNDQNPVAPNMIVELVFEPVKVQLKRDLEKYEAKRQRLSENGKRGGESSGVSRRSKANEANASKTKQNEANEAVSVNVNVSDNDILLKKETKVSSSTNSPPPEIDFKKLIGFFNENRGAMPEIKIISPARKTRIKNLIANHKKENLMRVIEKSKASRFMQGENDRSWIADFDWITKPANFIKILEGNYDNERTNIRPATPAAGFAKNR